MSLSIVKTYEERLVSAPVLRALEAGVESAGSAVLLVPSFAQALDAQRVLAEVPGLALSVTTTTPAAWCRERWEVWGDGRGLAQSPALAVLAREAVRAATPDERGPIELSRGVMHVLSQLVSKALPWLPLDEGGRVRADVCAQAGLTAAETALVGLAGRMGVLLRERGLASAAELSASVPGLLREAGVHMPHLVFAGFAGMGRADHELVCALSEFAQVTLVAAVCEGPASAQVERLVAMCAARMGLDPSAVPAEGADETLPRERELAGLCDALFVDDRLAGSATGAVELLLPAGPVAESEIVARRVSELAQEGASELVVATPDVARANRELVPKLAARGLTARVSDGRALLDSSFAQAFFGFAETVARLAELAASWPEPADGLEGPVAQLGDMSWWPPRELTDFLLSDIAHVEATRAWWTDATWRGNRLLTPQALLDTLQSEGTTSRPVALATTELLRGRLGTAASKLLLPYAEALEAGGAALDGNADEARAVLQGILQLAGTLRELGVTCDVRVEGAVPLAELVEVAQCAAEGMSVVSRIDVEDGGDKTDDAAGPSSRPRVRVMGVSAAAQLPPASVDALLVCGLTTVEQPIRPTDDLLTSLLELLAVEDVADPMAEARASFRALVAAPRSHLVLERATHDADSKPTYPSVMLAELLASYGIPASAEGDEVSLAHRSLSETCLSDNLAAAEGTRRASVVCDPAPAGKLQDSSRSLIFVPQDGSELQPGAKPVLSASQVETYLDCPYKWFSLRRLRLGTVDAGHGGMEMGTFAHRVLEVTHRELLARALEAADPTTDREELLARIEAEPACHVPGSRVDEATLDDARRALELEFDLHRQHMYMVKRPRLAQQLLVAHNSAERDQEDKLRDDLLSSLGYQTGILQGFEPRLFEWSFGRRGELVEYAGAYFTGTVDRIDVSPHGTAVIIDYKHKIPVGFAAEYDALQEGVAEGERLPNRVQSLIYAQVVRRAFEGRLRLVGSVYLSTRSPHALAGVADANVADLVFGRLRSDRVERVSVAPADDGGSGMDALLDRTEELVAEQVREMMAGNIEARPRDEHSCDFCPVMQCERRVAR